MPVFCDFVRKKEKNTVQVILQFSLESKLHLKVLLSIFANQPKDWRLFSIQEIKIYILFDRLDLILIN